MGYINLTLMKNILGIDGTGLDELITFYIDSATDTVKKIIGRDISLQETQSLLKGNDKNILYLENKPINSITSVLINGVDITGDVSIIEDGYALYYENGFEKTYDYITKTSSYSNEHYTRKEGKYNVNIIGFTGFTNIPTDIQNVVSKMVQAYYVKSGVCQQVKKQTDESEFGKTTTEYFNIEPNLVLTEEDKKILLKYR